jgi:hypothetical protein
VRQSSVGGLLSGGRTWPSRWRHGPGGDGGRVGWALVSRGPDVGDQWSDGWAASRLTRTGGWVADEGGTAHEPMSSAVGRHSA